MGEILIFSGSMNVLIFQKSQTTGCQKKQELQSHVKISLSLTHCIMSLLSTELSINNKLHTLSNDFLIKQKLCVKVIFLIERDK